MTGDQPALDSDWLTGDEAEARTAAPALLVAGDSAEPPEAPEGAPQVMLHFALAGSPPPPEAPVPLAARAAGEEGGAGGEAFDGPGAVGWSPVGTAMLRGS